MDRMLRKLHLNSQSAKTVILKEHRLREVSHRLLDELLDTLDTIFQEWNSCKEDNPVLRYRLVQRLVAIGRQRPRSTNEQPIVGARKPLKDMSLRVFRRWMTGYRMLGEHKYVPRRILEIERSPDYRPTRTLMSTTRRFPHKRSISFGLAKFVRSPLNILPHQEAELLWAVRYLARVPDEIIRHCTARVLDADGDFYVRIQSARLLSRTKRCAGCLEHCARNFVGERNSLIQAALLLLIVQMPDHDAAQFLKAAQFHPNDVVRAAGILLVTVRDDANAAESSIKHVFRHEPTAVMCDNVALLYAMTHSHEVPILQQLRAVLQSRNQVGQGDLSGVFDDLLQRIDRKLAPQLRLPLRRAVIKADLPPPKACNALHARAEVEREAGAPSGTLE